MLVPGDHDGADTAISDGTAVSAKSGWFNADHRLKISRGDRSMT